MNKLYIIPLLMLSNITLYAKIESPKKELSPPKKIVVKQRLQCNMTVKYKKRPKKVDNFFDIFTKGILYGRVRSNNLFFDGGSNGKSQQSYGIGGSLIFKSGRYKGFAFTSSIYGSQNLENVDKEEINNYSYGKDTFSRYVVATEGRENMIAFAQNYLSFKKHRVELKLGRFLVETFMLQSRDTKMIPNAFQGAHLRISTIPKTKIVLAYLTKQKLRDHKKFHNVFSYNDDSSKPYAQWTGNDDGSMHRGITTSKLNEKGIKDRIIAFEVKNRSIKNTQLRLDYTSVPELVSSAVIEGAYKFKLDNGIKIKPSLRYIQQFDNGAGDIGGANLRNDTRGYTDATTLESNLIAGRVDFIFDSSSLRLGYSKVGDKGDIISPWNGKPTAGYTRPMSGMNWYANTETFMIRADYDFPTNSFFEGLHIMSRYAINNFDDNKPGVTADNNVFTFNLIKRFKNNPNLFLKLRSIMVKEDHPITNIDGTFKKDPSYNALRLEMDYLF